MSPVALTLHLILTASAPEGALLLRVVEESPAGDTVTLPARVHLRGADGAPVRGLAAESLGPEGPRPAPHFHDHYSFDGCLRIRLSPGTYRYTVERGPEYVPAAGDVEIEADEKFVKLVKVPLVRWIDLARRGWWSGELHVHRPLEDMAILLRSEDLHVAPVLTVWNRRSLWEGRPLPESLTAEVEPTRLYHVLACEDERRGGALMYFNLTAPLDLAGDGPEYPSPVDHMEEAVAQPSAWIDVEKPFWWDMPVWVSTGHVRSIGLANNHMCRSGMLENEAWGRPRDLRRLPPPRGNGFYTQEIYYRLLNCGFRIPPSAGSASGVLPNPIGYNRVYVHLDGPFDYAEWWEGLAAGRSFVTNGPILLVEANGRLPGEVFRGAGDGTLTIELDIRVGGAGPLESVEVIRDGSAVQTLRPEEARGAPGLHWARPDPLRFRRSGWFLVRAIGKAPETFRFASTAPFYVEIGERDRTIHREDVEFFLEWIRERHAQVESSPHLESDAERASVLGHHRAARERFEALLETAE